MEGRNLVISGTIEEYRKNPGFCQELAEEPPKELTLYPGFKYEGYAWGMAIDQTACVGCNACVVACQAENNIPVVGKEQVLHAAARCTGCASIAISRASWTIPRRSSSRCRACTAKTPPASWCVRCRPPITPPKA